MRPRQNLNPTTSWILGAVKYGEDRDSKMFSQVFVLSPDPSSAQKGTCESATRLEFSEILTQYLS